jgi:hypothetical protein
MSNPSGDAALHEVHAGGRSQTNSGKECDRGATGYGSGRHDNENCLMEDLGGR